MKLVVVWLAIVLGVGVIATSTTSCSIRHKSDGFACTTSDDCDDGRKCDNGFCIDTNAVVDARTDGSSPIDGMNPRPDGMTDIDASSDPDAPDDICPQGCTSCLFDEHVCIVDCSAPGAACFGAVTCPPTWNCDIRCNVNGSCRESVDCSAGADCDISCKGNNSCRNMTCGSGACDVQCIGPGSCRNVNCGDACACDVSCDGENSCTQGITCSSPVCGDFGSGCTSSGLCDSCP